MSCEDKLSINEIQAIITDNIKDLSSVLRSRQTPGMMNPARLYKEEVRIDANHFIKFSVIPKLAIAVKHISEDNKEMIEHKMERGDNLILFSIRIDEILYRNIRGRTLRKNKTLLDIYVSFDRTNKNVFFYREDEYSTSSELKDLIRNIIYLPLDDETK
jgi:hypothetical protein